MILSLLSAAMVTISSCAAGAPADSLPQPVLPLNETLTNATCDTSVLRPMERQIERYMEQWHLQGVSLSIVRNDSLIYAKGFGWADKEKGLKMEPRNLLRLASISKLITAVGIMVLQERGQLSLQSKVFGPEGILKDSTYCSVIRDKNYYDITVEHLLRHKAGFTARYGDPMFSTRTIILQNHLSGAPDHKTLLRCMLRKRLHFKPGTSQEYSNLGYMILSEIIEQVSGQSYEDFIRDNVLTPVGCREFKIAGNYYTDRHENEVRYYVQANDLPVPEYNNSGDSVVRCYGGNDIKSLAGAGAWVASTPELALLVSAIDGREGIPDIISKESVDAMTEYFDQDTYSLGWNDTNPEKGWVRSGTFSGTNALIKYFPDGECWVFVSNTSTWKGPGLARKTAFLMSQLRMQYGSLLPARDLFHSAE